MLAACVRPPAAPVAGWPDPDLPTACRNIGPPRRQLFFGTMVFLFAAAWDARQAGSGGDSGTYTKLVRGRCGRRAEQGGIALAARLPEAGASPGRCAPPAGQHAGCREPTALPCFLFSCPSFAKTQLPVLFIALAGLFYIPALLTARWVLRSQER